LKIATLLGTWRSVPWCERGRIKEAAECLLSSSARRLSHGIGGGLVCSEGEFAVDDGRHGGVDWISTQIAVGYSTEYVGYR